MRSLFWVSDIVGEIGWPRAGHRLSVTILAVCVSAGILLFAAAPALASISHPYLSQFNGEEATLGGAFNPQGVAANETTGKLYVSDAKNKVVDVFSSTGVYESHLTEADGVTPYRFSEPWGVAVNQSTGGIFVADTGTGVIDVFDAAGVIQSQIGAGTLSGFARSVAVDDSTEHIYVADLATDAIYSFSSTGALLSTWTGTGTPSGSFGSGFAYLAVGVNQSSHDVYVVDEEHRVADRLSSSGVYLSQLTGADGVTPYGFSDPTGVSVDATGNVYVVDHGAGLVDQFGATGSLVGQLGGTPGGPFGSLAGVTVGSGEKVYVADNGVTPAVVDVFGPGVIVPGVTTGPASNVQPTSATLNGTVNPEGAEVTDCHFEYGTGTAYGQSLPCEQSAGQIGTGSSPVAVSANLAGLTAGTVYHFRLSASNVGGGTGVGADQLLGPPRVDGESASPVAKTTATLQAQVNPDGVDTTYHFEYGTSTSYGTSVPVPDGHLGSGQVDQSASVAIRDLQAGATYHFRVVATNSRGSLSGTDQTFTTIPPARIDGESVSDVGTASAVLKAKVDPLGTPTTVHFEYGTGTTYGSSTPEASLGASQGDVTAIAVASGLQQETVYHFRVVATNALGAAVGPDCTFETFAVSPTGLLLPDRRVYEMVSPIENADGEVYPPESGHQISGSHQTTSALPVRTSADGGAVAYVAAPLGSGGNGSIGEGLGNDFLATRAASGWNAASIMPPTQAHLPYHGFSSDLSSAFLTEAEQPLSPNVPPGCDVLYSRSTSDGAYHPAFTSTQTPGQCGVPRFAGVSADNSSVILETEAQLTPEAVAGNSGHLHETFNLYDSVAGHPYLVNVLPDGKPDVNAAFGGVSQAGEEREEEFKTTAPGYHHYGQAISADGSHIVWTALNTGDLYVRENPASPSASTVQVDASVGGGGQYQGATSDGSKVFFTKGRHLYQYDLTSAMASDLTPAGAVLGVMGVSEDGSYVYVVAENVLAGNENANGEKASTGQPNLYVVSAGETRFIATLSPEDNAMIGPAGQIEPPFWGDWRTSLRTRTAEVAADGRDLVFMSRRSITAYNNNGAHCRNPAGAAAACTEVFVYDAVTQRLLCASCSPSGEPPVAEGAFLPTVDEFVAGTYQLRWISEDGTRVFFDTSEPLGPDDENGVQDVYEWERANAGTCRQENGCIYLISGTLSDEEAYLVDASTSGNDVFFTTRAQLVPQDRNENIDLYDARVNGFSSITPPQCTGTGCQGVPPAPPIFATPASTTFQGAGNFPPPSQRTAGAKPKALTRSQKLALALRTCRRLGKRKRHTCEREAKNRYGFKSNAKRTSKRASRRKSR
jgi:NHL repeat